MVNLCNNKRFFRYLYQETNHRENKEFKAQVLADSSLQKEVMESQTILKSMDLICFTPSSKTTDQIMAYALANIKSQN